MKESAMRTTLYTGSELFAGFDRADPASFVSTYDFSQYRYFVGAGGPSPRLFQDQAKQGTCDAEIAFALREFVAAKTPRMVGIMGGHSLSRSSASFRLIVDVSRRLARDGYLVVTGGGPGAMEAGHIGAAFANSSDQALNKALARLADPAVATLVDCSKIVDASGGIAQGQEATIASAHAWLVAAFEARDCADEPLGESLAVPTWLYGQEPTTPFASLYAKYFQNSIREETLIANGRVGMLYARGGGGTLREIFQDVELNYYVRQASDFIPMIFVDPIDYWRTDASYAPDGTVVTPGVKLDVTLDNIFKVAQAPQVYAACKSKVLFTDKYDEIEAALSAGIAPAMHTIQKMLLGSATQALSTMRRL